MGSVYQTFLVSNTILSVAYIKIVKTQSPFTRSQAVKSVSTIQFFGLISFILDPWPPLLLTTSHLPLGSDIYTTLWK